MRRALARARAAAGGAPGREYSVVAWGRNMEGQCGVAAYLPLLLQPREVEAFGGLPVAALTAARTHSAGVLASGEVFTWGEGTHGKLGHGGTDSSHVPHCVESLAGRVQVVGAALGAQHSLFLDAAGQAWAVGENREGQCGLGTPLEELARQQRRQFEATAAAGGWAPGPGGGLAAAAGGGAAARAAAAASASAAAFEQQQFERSVEWFTQNAWHSAHLKPFLEHRERSAELEAATAMYDPHLRGLVQRQSAWRHFEAARGADVSIPGLMPAQIALPVRLGRARQGLFSPGVPELAGLDAETIVQLSAGRAMSACVTERGEVWVFGGGADAAGGGPAPGPRRVEGVLAEVLAANGGAVKVAAGGAFCVALTRSGRVVLWGQPGGAGGGAPAPAAGTPAAVAAPAAPSPARGRRRRALPRPAPAATAPPQHPSPVRRPPVESEELPNLRVRKQGGTLVAEVVDLPPMTDVAAGLSHVAMTDGRSAWSIGRQAAGGGGGGGGGAWLRPRRVLHRPDDGLAALAGGTFSAAAVTGGGDLYLWGTLLSEDAAAALLRKSEEEGLGHWAHSGTSDPAAMQWSGWEGLGGPEPRRVPGLHGVQSVTLGCHHAIAVVA